MSSYNNYNAKKVLYNSCILGITGPTGTMGTELSQLQIDTINGNIPAYLATINANKDFTIDSFLFSISGLDDRDNTDNIKTIDNDKYIHPGNTGYIVLPPFPPGYPSG
jgi:hypothetical protein